MPSLLAPAKINLALHITATRADGYHEISSLVTFADFGDRITVTPARNLRLEVTGRFAHALGEAKEKNLVWRAATALQDAAGVRKGAAIQLEKSLPIASGIGGGSSDAATAALLLNDLWGLGLSKEALAKILLPLGADIPMCLHRKTALISGIGEKISPMPSIPALGVVLVNPGVEVSTSEVFGFYDKERPIASAEIAVSSHAGEMLERLALLRNDLQEPAQRLCPVIGEVLEALLSTSGCLLSRMSGSGATCFGLYPDAEAAQKAAGELSRHHGSWWIAAGATENENIPQSRIHP